MKWQKTSQTRFIIRSGFHEVMEEIHDMLNELERKIDSADTAIKYFIGQVEHLAGHPNI